MASYKDPYNLTFNPYVQQRPVEAMMKVGVYKQERYDQGLQKIQESIDNIAGLDVVRDVDKQYLQSKLNQLGGQLSMVAGGDFSNFQLVNSVNGMTNQVAKDPNVLNAVASASRYRKALEEKQKIVQEGKGSASNDLLFNDEANAWLNSDDINAQYSGMYRPYKDYNNSARDIIKALGVKETGGDVAFNEKGQLVDAITRTRIKGISAERIQAALKQGLSPDDYQQLQIDGQYKYSNTSPDQYVNSINSSYQSTFTTYSQERDRLVALKNAAASPVEKQRLQDRIDSVDRSIEGVKSEYDVISQGFSSGDVKGSQAQLYTTNWLQDTSNAYATESAIQTYETNPFAQMQLRRDQMTQDAEIAKDRLDETKRYNNQRIEIENAKLKLLQNPYGKVELPTKKEATNIEVIAAAEAQAQQTQNLTDQTKAAYIRTYKTNEEQFNTDLIAYKTNTASVDWGKGQMLQQYIDSEKDSMRLKNTIIKAESEADIIANTKYAKLVPEELKGKTINGLNYLEAAALFDRFDKEYYQPARVQYQGGEFPERFGERQAEADRAANRLTDEQYGLYEIWANNKGSRKFKEDIDPTLNTVAREIYDVDRALKRKASQIEEERLNYLKNYYKETMIVPSQVAYKLPLGDAKQKDYFRGSLNSIAEIAERTDGLPGFEGNANSIRTMASDLQDAQVFTDSQGNYQINAINSKGVSLTIPITQDMYDSIFQGRFEPSPSMATFNQRYLPQMLSNIPPLEMDSSGTLVRPPQDFYTTSLDGGYNTSPDNAALAGPVDFPRVKYYGVSGNIASDVKPTETELLKLMLNVYDPISKKLVLENYLFPVPIRKEQLVPTLASMTDVDIWQLLNDTTQEMPTSVLKELEKASKQVE